MPLLIPRRPYADRPLRLAGQLAGDTLVTAWAVAWVWVAVQVHRAVTVLGTAGLRLRDGAGGVANHLRDAGGAAAQVPLAGDHLAAPLRSAGGAARGVASAGQQLADGVTAAALPLAVVVVAVTVLPIAIPWTVGRWRWARRAGAARRLGRTAAGMRLLALRALAGAAPERLAALDPDPVSAWMRQDDATVAALAALELRRLGLR